MSASPLRMPSSSRLEGWGCLVSTPGPVAAPQSPVSSEMSLCSPGLQEGEGDTSRERKRGCRHTKRTDASQRRTFILRVTYLRRINISVPEHCKKRSFLAPFVHPHLECPPHPAKSSKTQLPSPPGGLPLEAPPRLRSSVGPFFLRLPQTPEEWSPGTPLSPVSPAAGATSAFSYIFVG